MPDPSRTRSPLLEAWSRLTLKLAGSQSQSPVSQPFSAYAWDVWDPEIVLAILMGNADGFFSQQEILHAGFCSWVIAPDKARRRKAAIAAQTAHGLVWLEERARKRFGNVGQLGDIYARAVTDREFFEQVYYPIGGLKQVLKSHSRASLSKAFLKSSKCTGPIVSLLKLYHYHVEHLLPLGWHHWPSP
ncbi:MAG TPA: hypothetical protein VGN97_16445 [Mesorhizobium sp.]|jgi:hypothetical protein|nr:hypothetical protein [Mesorhizobium sp.]